MKTLIWRIITVLIILISWVMYTHPDWIVDPPSFFTRAAAATCVGNPDGKCEFNPNGALDKDPTPTDPNRPYFDACGNEYDYLGNLISQGTGCQPTQPTVSQQQTIPNDTPPATQPEVFYGK